jgi:hypothetical protein
MSPLGVGFNAASKTLVKRWPWAFGLVLVVLTVAGPLSGGDVDKGGAVPYTPTQGEWLCLLLNTQEALFSSEQQPDDVAVRYVYERSQPNKIKIVLLYTANTNALELRRQVQTAQQQALDVAKTRGWDKWLKLEVSASQSPGRRERQILEQ